MLSWTVCPPFSRMRNRALVLCLPASLPKTASVPRLSFQTGPPPHRVLTYSWGTCSNMNVAAKSTTHAAQHDAHHKSISQQALYPKGGGALRCEECFLAAACLHFWPLPENGASQMKETTTYSYPASGSPLLFCSGSRQICMRVPKPCLCAAVWVWLFIISLFLHMKFGLVQKDSEESLFKSKCTT